MPASTRYGLSLQFLSTYAENHGALPVGLHSIVLEVCSASRNREIHQGSIEVLRQRGLFPLLRVMPVSEFLKGLVNLPARGKG